MKYAYLVAALRRVCAHSRLEPERQEGILFRSVLKLKAWKPLVDLKHGSKNGIPSSYSYAFRYSPNCALSYRTRMGLRFVSIVLKGFFQAT